MAFSLFRVKYVPIYTVSNANLAWIMQDYLLGNGISANIEVEPCESGKRICNALPAYSVCVPGSRADEAKRLADACEAVKISGFLSAQL
ncbi:MAG: hypothetical protein UY31_C0073G0010 [Candidatus Wolfebacteria bacterium GW2011_GWE1_48_7]|uniref:DUF2007 domain-containing protein n=2 Tax=Candidatus Wolfeibacteriota TaxID=1752735 RepID=A0A0G1U5V1_9BACT|nr:MAG: hypothetical protein UX70_C0001G0576 [Candidatus Wolfebacteria bacterium GW2011_GWB1_47_1]KKU34826.1 MAG: hypothetical protein UX49_C0034G0009 [Candidatus Wolfebacteria bacterium GW2011_GWC2_46_275]KKU42491.1 MAG: hypothetical protein UX58_C0002G0205 [Candidatus Wolfebacteria bacterium GW2011_GWB2_46_69]KKU54276.1 MAG: hypothetical protein UX76_C0004G0080 [Candidatus Wolfebacteria bacterium GW2011_GWC1_47_103]KKU59644.1 MAG: hypothetical protein UX83_C0003G0059 [Candidatus Wolfebacteria